MRLGLAARGLLLIAVACGDSSNQVHDRTVRVAAVHGLGDGIVPSSDISGASAYAVELVFDPFDHHGEIIEVHDDTVRIRTRSERSDEDLARTFSANGFTSATVLGRGEIALGFDTVGAAAAFAADPDDAGFDIGPFSSEAHDARVIRLRRRSSAQPATLELVLMNEGEQWRRLLARDVDVVPFSSPVHRRQYEEVATLRLIEYRDAEVGILLFNSRLPFAARQAVGFSLDRDSLANIVCPSGGCRASVEPQPAEKGTLPDELHILVMKDSDILVLLARSLRLQLLEHRVDARVTALPFEGFVARAAEGGWDAVIMPRRAVAAAVEQASRDFSGFTGFDPATTEATRDWSALALIEWTSLAAVDEGLCGGEPTHYTSWKWLADLRPCEDGE